MRHLPYTATAFLIWQVEELELNHQHLRKLHDLERLVNLRRASFCNNELTRLEGLERCVLLEELRCAAFLIWQLPNLATAFLIWQPSS